MDGPVGSINIKTDTTYTIGVAGRPTRVFDVMMYCASALTNGALILYNASSTGTEYVRLTTTAGTTGNPYQISFSDGLLFPNTCYAAPNSGTTYSTITYQVESA